MNDSQLIETPTSKPPVALEPQVVWHQASVRLDDRIQRQGHQAGVVWFTGLSGSGKSTVANFVDHLLWQESIRTFLLDGDNVRHGLCATPSMLAAVHGDAFAQRFGLGFGPEDRQENIRRVGAAAGLLVGAGLIVLTAFVSPYRIDRLRVRDQIEKDFGAGSFMEVFVDTPLDICELRDPKGLYKQARAGKIANFTGISDPYESPESPDLWLDGSATLPDELARLVVAAMKLRNWIS